MSKRAALLGLSAACLLLTSAGCKPGDDSAGNRLIGRWQCSGKPATPQGATLTWTFGGDGSFAMTFQGPGLSKTVTGKYHAGRGDVVYMDQFSEPVGGSSNFTDEITVGGDQMTVRDPDGATAVFTRVPGG